MDRKLIILICIANLWVAPLQAQHPDVKEKIRAEVNSALAVHALEVNNELLSQDLAYSVQFLSDIADTLSSPMQLDRVLRYLAELQEHITDACSEIKTEYISSLIAFVKNPLVQDPGGITDLLFLSFLDDFKAIHLEAMRDTLFFRGKSWRLPILIAKFELTSEIPKLKRWGQNSNLYWWIYENYLNAALARLGDKETIASLVSKEFDLSISDEHLELKRHFDILNYARRRETTEKLFQYLFDEREIEIREWGDGSKDYGKVYGLALYHLEMVVEDFPCKIINYSEIVLNYSGKSELIEEKVKIARKWYTKHKNDYQIIKNSDNFERYKY
jgi:hypothetical protein